MEMPEPRCIRCGVEGKPRNPDQPNRLRWEMPPGWILVEAAAGGWGRNCPRCAEVTRQRHLAYLRSPARMPLIVGTVMDFWEHHPTRRLGEVIALVARMRRTDPSTLDDLQLASALRIFTPDGGEHAFAQAPELAPIDPWALFPIGDESVYLLHESVPRKASMSR